MMFNRLHFIECVKTMNFTFGKFTCLKEVLSNTFSG